MVLRRQDSARTRRFSQAVDLIKIAAEYFLRVFQQQAAEDTRQDLQEIKGDLRTTEARLGKVETAQARLKALAGVVVAAGAGGASWLGLK